MGQAGIEPQPSSHEPEKKVLYGKFETVIHNGREASVLVICHEGDETIALSYGPGNNKYDVPVAEVSKKQIRTVGAAWPSLGERNRRRAKK